MIPSLCSIVFVVSVALVGASEHGKCHQARHFAHRMGIEGLTLEEHVTDKNLECAHEGETTCCNQEDESLLKSALSKELDSIKKRIQKVDKELERRAFASLLTLDDYRLSIVAALDKTTKYRSQSDAIEYLAIDFTNLFNSDETTSSILPLLKYFRRLGLSILVGRFSLDLSWLDDRDAYIGWECDTDLCIVEHVVMRIIDPNWKDRGASDPLQFIADMSDCFDRFIWKSKRITSSLEELARVLFKIRTDLLFLCRSCRKIFDKEILCPLCRSKNANTCKIFDCFERLRNLNDLWNRAVQSVIDLIEEVEKTSPCPCIKSLENSTLRIMEVDRLMNHYENASIHFKTLALHECCNTSSGHLLRSLLGDKSDQCANFSDEQVTAAREGTCEIIANIDVDSSDDACTSSPPSGTTTTTTTTTTSVSDKDYLKMLIYDILLRPTVDRWCPEIEVAYENANVSYENVCSNPIEIPVIEQDAACETSFYEGKQKLNAACCTDFKSAAVDPLVGMTKANCLAMCTLSEGDDPAKCGRSAQDACK